MSVTRRTVLASALLAPSAAFAQTARPDWLANHPAMRAWDPPHQDATRFLESRVQPADGSARIPVRDWLGGRAGVVTVWATWCGPCLREKPPEAQLSQRLAQAGSRAQVKALLAYDRASLPDAQLRLASIGASALETGRASEAAEQALLTIFGIRRMRNSVISQNQQFEYLRTTLPFTLLFDTNGNLLGQAVGMMQAEDGRSYWQSLTTFDLLQRLAA